MWHINFPLTFVGSTFGGKFNIFCFKDSSVSIQSTTYVYQPKMAAFAVSNILNGRTVPPLQAASPPTMNNNHRQDFAVNNHRHDLAVNNHPQNFVVSNHRHNFAVNNHRQDFTANNHRQDFTANNHRQHFAANNHRHDFAANNHRHDSTMNSNHPQNFNNQYNDHATAGFEQQPMQQPSTIFQQPAPSSTGFQQPVEQRAFQPLQTQNFNSGGYSWGYTSAELITPNTKSKGWTLMRVS